MNGAGALAAALTALALAGGRAGAAGRRRATVRARARSSFAGAAARAGDGAGLRPAPARPALGAPPWLAARLADAGVDLDPARVWTGWVAALVAAAAGAASTAGPGGTGLVVALGVAGPWVGWRLLRHRGSARLEAALPGAVEAMAGALRSGASLRQAIGEAAAATPGALGADLAAVAAATVRGAPVVTALEGWASRRPLPGVRLVVGALCLGAETGGATAQAVDGVAATLRQRLAAQAEAKALATQARLSAGVIAAAPVAFCLLSAATDRRSAAFLLQTPAGLALLGAGLALDAAGALWMSRLTRIEP